MFIKIGDLIKKFISKPLGFCVKTTANFFLSKEIPGLGEIVYLNINTELKKIEIHLYLNGESDGIQILINGYRIIDSNGEKYITFRNIKSQKPWVNALINKFVPVKKILPIDKRLAWLIKHLI